MKSWKEAKAAAHREDLPLVFHDHDTGTYGACGHGESQGTFREGEFIEHRCICMPAAMSETELAGKEKKFLEENPDW